VAKVTNPDNEIDPDEWIVFRASDKALIPTLEFYQDKCAEIGAGDDHINGIRDLIRRLQQWQGEHPERMKIPD
jgi:hypothetical protein